MAMIRGPEAATRNAQTLAAWKAGASGEAIGAAQTSSMSGPTAFHPAPKATSSPATVRRSARREALPRAPACQSRESVRSVGLPPLVSAASRACPDTDIRVLRLPILQRFRARFPPARPGKALIFLYKARRYRERTSSVPSRRYISSLCALYRHPTRRL
jgi:hypothetical protein